MSLLLVLLAQAFSPGTAEAISLAATQPCRERRSSTDEIVICKSRDEPSPYRINQPVQQSRQAIPPASIKIAKGVNASADTEAADVGGFPSNRLMLRLKIKF
jgi:hypothetical protein